MVTVLFKIGSYPIYSYSVAMLSALIVCLTIACLNVQNSKMSINDLLNLCLITMFSIIVGNRFLLFISNKEVIKEKPLRLLTDWSGGNNSAILSLTLTLTSVFFFCKYKKKSFPLVLDFILPIALIGLAIQRVCGCFMAGCCYGLPTEMPWGVTFPINSPAGAQFPGINIHPTQLYYGVSAIFVYCAVGYISKKVELYPGGKSSLCLIGLSFFYYIIGFLRGDVTHEVKYAGATISQLVALLIIVFCTALWFHKKFVFNSNSPIKRGS